MLQKIIKKFYFWYKRVTIVIRLLIPRKKTVYLFGCPIHAKIGDQAQTYCIEKWLQANYPEHSLIKLDWSISYPLILRLIRILIKKDDLIFCHSGYFLVDHHSELPVYCKVISKFPDHRIVILPQTINLSDKDLISKVSQIFNSHPRLYLLCRDEVSHEKAQEIFSKCRLLLYPDVVTSLIGKKKYEGSREGILFCIRNDGEAFYSAEQVGQLSRRLGEEYETTKSDTSIGISRIRIERAREEVINDMLDYFAKFSLIITDRYHGTIFSLITATPVIVLSSSDHKLSSGVKWFPKEFKDYIVYAKNMDMAYDLAIEMLGEVYSHDLPPYFQDNYYKQLKDKLNDH
jgi:exopolysaccharide biosynthesis predicted pyruvyltransferase EpsI